MSDEGSHTPKKGEENERRTEWRIRRLRVEDDEREKKEKGKMVKQRRGS